MVIEIPLIAAVTVAVCLAALVVVLGTALLHVSRKSASHGEIETGKGDKSQKREKRWFRLSSPVPSTLQKQTIQPAVEKHYSFFERVGIVKGTVTEQKREGEEQELGRLNFALSYDKESTTLNVHVIQASDLPAKDLCGSSDPYVRIFLLPNQQQVKATRVHRRTLNPSFNQIVQFTGHAVKQLEEFTLCMQVLDFDRFSRDDPIGEVLLPLKSVKYENTPVYWKTLQKPTIHKKAKGEVMLSLCYLPQSNRLTVVVIKAKDLPAKDVSGSSDPYVKVWLIDQGDKVEKKKTTIKNHTLCPTYNETFSFTVSPEKTQEMNLVATVMDHDLLSSNDEIGHVILGPKGSESGMKQWRDMLARPGFPTAMWHSLAPRW